MRVRIQISIYSGDAYTYYGSLLVEVEASVVAEPGAMDAIPWNILCAGLAQRAITEAKPKIEEEAEESDAQASPSPRPARPAPT